MTREHPGMEENKYHDSSAEHFPGGHELMLKWLITISDYILFVVMVTVKL